MRYLNKTTQQEQPQKQSRSNRGRQLFRDCREIIAILILFMIFYMLCFRIVIVVGGSMFDTLMDGDRLVLLSNVFYREPACGDIIVASKDSFRGGECIVKRVIATEGQTVDIDFSTGAVYVDGQLLDEPYLYSQTMLAEGIKFPLTVDEGCLFVMGDNRMDSCDSRSPQIGLIDRREVLGKAVFLLFPGTHGGTESLDLSRIGGLG